MGVDFIAILKHTLSIPAVRELPVALTPDAAPRLARATAALARTGDPIGSAIEGEPMWHINESEMSGGALEEVWASGGPIELAGPHNLHLGLFRQGCELSDSTRWQAFLGDQPRQLALRRCCYELARILGSPSAIYVPDDAGVVLWDGLPYEQIPAWLHEWYGSPPPTLSVVTTARPLAPFSARDFGGERYFIDTFADFTQNAGDTQ